MRRRQRGALTLARLPHRHAPFLVPFEDRARIFAAVIAADRTEHRERGAYGPQSFVTVHRATLMQARMRGEWCPPDVFPHMPSRC